MTRINKLTEVLFKARNSACRGICRLENARVHVTLYSPRGSSLRYQTRLICFILKRHRVMVKSQTTRPAILAV